MDREYRDYIDRREKEGFLKRASSKKDERRPPSGRFIPNNTVKKPDAAAQAKEGGYEMPNNVYHSSGYKQKLSELGEDPISTVRTMRNNLRNRSIKYKSMDKPVKSHLCESACDQLSHAEAHLLKMNEKRSNALLVGDTREAEKIKKEMDEYKERAVKNTYADLIMDDDEMRAFGVDSMWTPDVSIPTGVTRSRRIPSGHFAPRQAASNRRNSVKKERAQTPNYAPNFTKTEKPTEWDPEVRKNERLSSIIKKPEQNRPYEDDPYKIPRNMGTCDYCHETGPSMGNRTGIEDHYARECKMMNRCRYCQKVVLVSKLTDHYLNRCTFLGDRMTKCTECGLAKDKIDQDSSVKHPLCREKPPPAGAQWCPLCAVAVDDRKENWEEHLKEICYNNTRQKESDEPISQVDPYGSSNGKNGTYGSSDSNRNGRMIDADKLVVALQAVQMKKKKKRQETLAKAEENSEKAE